MFSRNGMATTYLGKCKGCRSPKRALCEVVRVYDAHLGYGRTERRTERRKPDGQIFTGDYFSLPCACGRNVLMQRVIGRKSDHKCGAKCINSTGHICECSCKGANHGAGIALATTGAL